MSLIPYLLHAKTRKEGDSFVITLRTKEGAELLKRLSEKKGIEVIVEVNPAPHHFKSKQELLDYWRSTNEIFDRFYQELGLQII
jgi:hypothetical protein